MKVFSYEYRSQKKAKNYFEKKNKLINYAGFEKSLENVRKHGDVKVVTFEKRKNYLLSEPNHHTTNFFLKIY